MLNYNKAIDSKKLKNTVLNFGPQHPAAHGILKLSFKMSGEVISNIDNQFGLLHRGVEKLMENRTWIQNLPYMDRFDYVANILQEHAYCLSIEHLLNNYNQIPWFFFKIRVLFDEFSRILNHLLTLSATSLDLGAMGPIFWAFEERENLMMIFEKITGARMHTALYKPLFYNVSWFSLSFLKYIIQFLFRAGRSLNLSFLSLVNNKSLKARLSYVGQLSSNKSRLYNISGVIGRSSGLFTDLRFNNASYFYNYKNISFKSFLGLRGDNYDRFLIRIKEVLESYKIITQVLNYLNYSFNKKQSMVALSKNNLKLKFNNYGLRLFKKTDINGFINKPVVNLMVKNQPSVFFNSSSNNKFTSMENLITHFKYYSSNFNLKKGYSYGSVESPKGELGVHLWSNNTNKAYKLSLKTPVSHNMHLIPLIAKNNTFGDFVASFCSLDIVLGEIDR